MGMVTIRCPNTGRSVATGIVLTPEQFARGQLGRNVLRCTACGRVHHWSREDAELQGDPPDSPADPSKPTR